MLVILILLCFQQFSKYFELYMTKERYSSFLSLFEKLVLMEHLMRQEELEKNDIALLRTYIPMLMSLFKETINRKDGMECRFVKFHVLLHLPDDMERMGSPQTTSSNRPEKGHKFIKQAEKTTQKQYDCFYSQVGKSYANQLPESVS